MKRVDQLLRLALGFPFLYASFGSLTSPKDWIWYIPDWLAHILPPEPLLLGHGAFELFLGAWLLTGKKTMIAAYVAATDLTINTLLNIQTFNVVFRDVGLLAAAIALVLLHKESEKALPAIKIADSSSKLSN
jgi:uncharacterized membrane protein YphA (DoxX/SURF4 family)